MSGPVAAGDARAEAQLRRLRWHCRRGMKELDLLLERFAQRALGSASGRELAAFAELLALPDPALARYLLGGEIPAAPHLADLVARIRALCRSGGGSALFSGSSPDTTGPC
jgi:antitoxin CptB